jgi:iron complex transport system substrate-binding protein
LPQRIVSLQPSATVILAALGELRRVVACTKYCADVCPEVRDGRTIVDDSWTVQSTQITAAHPDLVIAAVPYQEKSVSEILRSGTRFLGLAPKTLADIYTDVAMIAGLVGAGERAEALITNMQAQIESVRDLTRRLPRPKVFCEEWGKPIIRSQRWVAELVEASGGEFLGAPGTQCSPEAVLAEDPDIVIAAWCGAGDRVPLEKMIRNRGWTGMKAVSAARVYCISDELLNTPAPTLMQGLDMLTVAIHPELCVSNKAIRQISANTVKQDAQACSITPSSKIG